MHVFKLEQEVLRVSDDHRTLCSLTHSLTCVPLCSKEYVREKINWSFIDYADNQPCIELIEARMGILDLLDEQCRLPSGTDATFVAKLYSELASPAKPHPNFQKARFGEKSFTIKHYATPVEYDAEGFLDKNRDTLPEEIITMLKESTFDFAAELFDKVEVAVGDMVEMGSPTAAAKRSRSIMAGSQTDLLGGPKGAAGRGGLGGGASVASVMNLQAPTSPTGGVYSSAMSLLAPKPSAMKTASSMAALSSNANLLGRGGARKKPIKPTLSSVFKESLRKLMDTINFTNVHYIRCLKPSPTMKPFQIDNLYTLQQLRACGVLETIRISCAGYPGRYGFSEFAERYRLLDTVAQPIVDARMAAKQILQSIVTDMDKYQVGETKIFLRAGLVAYLEKRRADELNRVVTLIQKRVRGYLARKRYLRKRNAIIRIQRGMGECDGDYSHRQLPSP